MALHAARRGLRCTLWSRTVEHAGAMRDAGVNARYLGDFPLGDVEVTSDLEDLVTQADALIVAVPSHAFRDITRLAADAWRARGDTAPILLIAAKGVETESLSTMAQVVEEELGPDSVAKTAALGGPSFAKEVAAGQPTAVVVASASVGAAEAFQDALSGDGLRVYVTRDVTGVELAGREEGHRDECLQQVPETRIV